MSIEQAQLVEQEQGGGAFPGAFHAWSMLAILSLGACFAFIDRIAIALVAPAIQHDLALSDSQLGLLQGLAFSLFYTLFGIPLGLVADRWNRKHLLVIGMSVWSLMTALSGFAKGFGTLFAARLGVGMGEATLNPCVSSLVSDLFPPQVRARAFSLYTLSQGVGLGLTYIVGGVLLGWLTVRGGLEVPGIGMFKPWQALLLVIGLTGLLPPLLLLTTAREPPRREMNRAQGQRASLAEVCAFVSQNKAVLVCHHLGISLTMLVFYSFSNWMPTFFLRAHGWEPQQFSVIFGALSIVGGLSAPLGVAWVMGRMTRRNIADASWRLMIIGSIGCACFGVAAPLMPTPALSMALFTCAGLLTVPLSINAFVSISQFVPNEMRGLVTASYFLVNGLLAAGVGPFAVGFVTDHILGSPAAIPASLSLVSFAAGMPAAGFLIVGRRAFRKSVERANWAATVTKIAAPAVGSAAKVA